jgi:hypothetical protein
MEFFLYQTLNNDQTDESELGNLNLHLDDTNILSLVVQFVPIKIKVMLIGESHTGKTSFVNKLQNGNVFFQGHYSTLNATHSFYMYKKNVEFEFIEIPGHVYELNIDTCDFLYSEIDYIFKFMRMNKVTFHYSYAWITRVSKFLHKNVKIKSIVDSEHNFLTEKIHRISIKNGYGINELLDEVISYRLQV